IGDLKPLDEKIAALYTDGTPVTGSRPLESFWKALGQSSNFPAFDAELKELAAKNELDRTSAHAALAKHFVEFAGTHRGVLDEHPEGPSLLDHLQEELAPAKAPT